MALSPIQIRDLSNQVNDLSAQLALGAGTRNYVANPKFTLSTAGVPDSWSLFNTTLTSKIPTGSITAGAASITSFLVDATTPIEGTFDLRVGSSGILAAGQGFISAPFTIEREDQAKVMGFSFAYEAVSGTMDFSGTSSNTWAVYIYDVSGAAWIQPAGVYNLVQGSGVGIASGTFQTTSNSTQYRLAVICITATSGAVEMRFDDFQLGPQKVVYGSPVTDWQSYTPTFTGFGTGTMAAGYPKAYWRRVGDSVELHLLTRVSTAGSGSGNFGFGLPNGFKVDGNKLNLNTSVYDNTVGSFSKDGGGQTPALVITTTGNDGNIYSSFTGSSMTSGMYIGAFAKVPVVGLSSSVQMSNDSDTRVVAARAVLTTAGTTLNGNAYNRLNYNSVQYDTHSAITTGAGVWKYTIPIGGYYKIGASINTGAVVPATYCQILMTPVINGVVNSDVVLSHIRQSTISFNKPSGSTQYKFNAGDYFYIQSICDNPVNSATLNEPETGWVTVERLSGPATIAASETVAMSALKFSGNHTALASEQIVSAYTSVSFDTHSAFNPTTGIFTAPISGSYLVTGSLGFQAAAPVIAVSVNNSSLGSVNTSGTRANLPFGGVLKLKAGETIALYAYQNSSASFAYAIDARYAVSLSIVRVGN